MTILKKIINTILLVISINVYALNPSAYGIATANSHATMAGIEILEQNGNAFDAAIAISAVLAVVEPYHSGLGGGGFWLLYDSKTDKNVFIDGRETAPLKANKDMFVSPSGEVLSISSFIGGKAALIPGEVAALVYIAKQYGKLPLSKTLAPAIRLAEHGFQVDPYFYKMLNIEDRAKQLMANPAARKIFFKHGREPYHIGDVFIQKDLAKTLNDIALHGRDGFYGGKVAQLLVSGVNSAGGIWSLEDLKNYQIKVREPLVGYYKDMKIVTAPLPSAGGVSLQLMLKILSGFDLTNFNRVKWTHYLSESMRLAFWQRANYLGDPDSIQVDLKKIFSEENIKYLRSLINPDKALKSSELKQKMPETLSPTTTHFSVIDKEGNRVAATLSINHIFGSGVVAEGTGVLLNNEMNDFSLKANVSSDLFGIVGSEKNSIAPNKRPLSNMSPTFLETPKAIAILGTPGGSRIPTMVLLAAMKFYNTQSAISMIAEMRFHHQFLPDWLQFEPFTFSPDEIKKLQQMGYEMHPLKQFYGDMQVVTWDLENNFVTAVSDPRKQGLAAVVSQSASPGYGFNY